MHKHTASILDISNAFKSTNVPIRERVYVIPPPYYLDWFESYYPNVPTNWYDSPFCIQCMNGIHATELARRQWNQLLGAVVTVLKYRKITIYHAIYIKFLSGGTVSNLTVSTDDVLNTDNNETKFTYLRGVFEEYSEIKFQEGSVLKYLHLRIFLSLLGFSVYQNDNIL